MVTTFEEARLKYLSDNPTLFMVCEQALWIMAHSNMQLNLVDCWGATFEALEARLAEIRHLRKLFVNW